MDDVEMTSDAVQPSNFLVSVGMDLHPDVVRLRLAGPRCNGGKLARCTFVAGFCTISLNILCGLSSCNKAFFLLQGNQSHKLCIHDLRWLKEKKKEWSISVTRVRLWKKQKKRFEFDIYINLAHVVWASFILPAVGVDYLHYLKSDNALKKIATYVKDMASHWRHATYVYEMLSC